MKSICWNLKQSLAFANAGYDSSNKLVKISNEIWNKKLNVKRGDQISLVYYDGKPIITHSIKGNTIKDILKSLENGLRKPLEVTYENAKKVYITTSSFRFAKDRIKIIKLFENKKLCPIDLIGNYQFFEGSLKRTRNGTWVYDVGS